MAAKRQDRQAQRWAGRVRAKKDLKARQEHRRGRDNLIGLIAMVLAMAAAVTLQVSVFRYYPTVEQMSRVEQGLDGAGAAGPIGAWVPAESPVNRDVGPPGGPVTINSFQMQQSADG